MSCLPFMGRSPRRIIADSRLCVSMMLSAYDDTNTKLAPCQARLSCFFVKVLNIRAAITICGNSLAVKHDDPVPPYLGEGGFAEDGLIGGVTSAAAPCNSSHNAAARS